MGNALFFFVLFILNILVFLLALNIFTILKRTYAMYKINNKYVNIKSEYQKRVADMKASGEMHEWITINKTTVNGNKDFIVCKKTGWCPEINDFFLLDYIKQEVARQETQKKYDEFKQSELSLLAEKYSLTLEDMEVISEKVFDIKKQFFLKNMESQDNE
jgi:hypothetical protein